VPELTTALILARATYERWLGTEPTDIADAAASLRLLQPDHPLLPGLEHRLQRSAMIKTLLERSWAEATRPQSRLSR
jgi:hypothetical protein